MVWSLEHEAKWWRSVQAKLWLAGVKANVLLAPLEVYDSFEWYRVPVGLPHEFGLVICDGPPGDTPGGRYGLLPILGDRLRKGTIILLDDAERADEQAVLDRWAKDAGWQYKIQGEADKTYAVITV